MTSPSLLSRESTTLSPRFPQNGHFIGVRQLLLPRLARQVAKSPETQTVLHHEDEAGDDHGKERDGVQDEPCSHGLILRRAEEGRHAVAVGRVIAADAGRRRYRNADDEERLEEKADAMSD